MPKKENAKPLIPLFKVYMPASVMAPLKKTLLSGYITQGPRVEEFEGLLRKRLKTKHVLTVNSGTSALQLAVKLSGIEPGRGDEVITTALTCTATNWAILAAGGVPVWADVDQETANIDWRTIEARITPKTKAIMVVHWGGTPCDMDEINAIAQKHNLKVIEDCAHAFGATYKGKPLGTVGDFGAFSLQAIKHMTTVDGGLLIAKDEQAYKRGKLLRWYGIDREERKGSSDFRVENDIPEWGYKMHMNDVNATIGIEQLKYVNTTLKKHQANAAFYNKALKGVAGVELMPLKAGYKSAYWIYTLKVDRREDFMRAMKERGIMVSRVHERNDKHSCVAAYKRPLPQLDELSQKIICIPVGWWLTPKQRQYIVDSIKKGW